jgi:hypothetical protein
MEKADETTDTSGYVNKDCDDRIDGENTIIDQGKDLFVQGGVEMNDATPMDDSSVIIVEQNIVQDGVTFITDLLTTVDFNNDEDSNSEEVEFDNDGIGGSTDIQKLKMIPEVHPSNLAQNTLKNQKRSSQLLLKKMLMIGVKAASLTTVISLKHLLSNNKMNLNYHSSLDHLH